MEGQNDGQEKNVFNLPNLVQEIDALHSSFLGNSLVWFTRSQSLLDMMSASSSENDDVQERVGSKTISSMNRDTCSLSSSVKTGYNLILTFLVNSDHFAGELRRDTAH